jgi:nucleotide-binding universal stress UspA family protein
MSDSERSAIDNGPRWTSEGGHASGAVVVLHDGSPAASAALPVARTLAAIHGTVIHVLYPSEQPLDSCALMRRLELRPEQLGATVLESFAGGPAALVGIARALGCPFIVVCTRGSPAPREEALDRAASEIVRTAPCPVVLVDPARGDAAWKPARILVPLDGTPSSVAAVQPAIELAARAQAALLLVHVAAGERPPPSEVGTLATPQYVDQVQHEWPAWRSEFMARAAQLGHIPAELPVRLFLVAGEPGREIVRFAREHRMDLIAFGWRGALDSRAARAARTVLREAPCPIVVFRIPRAIEKQMRF